MITHLTSSSNSPLDSWWMPWSDTSDFSKTSMSLSWKFFTTKSLNNTTESFTFSGTKDINSLKVLKDLVNSNFFLKENISKLNFILNRSSIDLDFINISLFSLKVKSLWLTVTDKSNSSTIFNDLISKLFWFFSIRFETLLILRESSSLRLEPILIKSSLERIRKRSSKDGS